MSAVANSSTTFVFLNFIRVRFKMPLNSVHSYAWRGVQSNLPTSPAKVYTPSEHFPMRKCEICTVLYAKIERKGARRRLNRRIPILEKAVTRGERCGSPEGFQIAVQVRTKSGTSGGNAGGLVVVHSTRVEKPKNMDCHRVASLKTETKASAKDRRVGRPGKGSVL